MNDKRQLQIGEHCFVYRPDDSFAGTVIDLRKDRVRVAGPGSIYGTRYDEWFPIKSKLLTVEPAG